MTEQKKLWLTAIALAAAIALMSATIYTFFSDAFSARSDITVGTLELVRGQVSFVKNGAAVPNEETESSSLEGFMPDDVIVVSIPVINAGKKSAWLRGVFELSGEAIYDELASGFTDFDENFAVYEGAWTLDQLAAGGATLAAAKMAFSQNAAEKKVSWADVTPAVINGCNALADYESETGSYLPTPNAPLFSSGANQNEGTLQYTIFFKGEGNIGELDQKLITVTYGAEAIQYRNNSSAVWSAF